MIDADGWMHGGGMAATWTVMDDDGYVRIAGRLKDMVIRGGGNIYPREIEEFLYTHPGIANAQVIGVPDDAYGARLMAVVTLRDGAPVLTVDRLRDFCAGRLAHFKIPRYPRVADELPTTVTGKIRKDELRRQAIEFIRELGE